MIQDIINEYQEHKPLNTFPALYILSTISDESFRRQVFEHLVRYYLPHTPFGHSVNSLNRCSFHNSQYLSIQYPNDLTPPNTSDLTTMHYSQAGCSLLDKSSGKQYYLYVTLSVRYADNREFQFEERGAEFLKQSSLEILHYLSCQPLPHADVTGKVQLLMRKYQNLLAEWPDLLLEVFTGCLYKSSLGWRLKSNIKGQQTVYGTNARGIRFLIYQNKTTEWTAFHKELPTDDHGFIFITNNDAYLTALESSPSDHIPLACHAASFLYCNHLEPSIGIDSQTQILQLHALLCQRLASLRHMPTSFWHADRKLTIARLVAIEAKTVAEYLCLLNLERHHLTNMSIVNVLDEVIQQGSKIIPLPQDEEKDNEDPFIACKCELIHAFLQLAEEQEHSWAYWVERVDTPETCKIQGAIARLTTTNFLLDQLYRTSTFSDLEVLIQAIRTTEAAWSVSVGFAKQLKNIADDQGQLRSRRNYAKV